MPRKREALVRRQEVKQQLKTPCRQQVRETGVWLGLPQDVVEFPGVGGQEAHGGAEAQCDFPSVEVFTLPGKTPEPPF